MTLRPKHNTYGDILFNRRYPSIHPQEPSLTKGETLFYAGAIITLLAATLAIVVCFIL